MGYMKETRVVAGVDGSDDALQAVRAATLDAARRGCGLKLVHAFVWPELKVPTGPPEGFPPEAGLRPEAERFLEDAAKVAAHTDPRVPVTTELVTGGPARVLLGQAHEAEVIVLGSRGLGGFSGLLVGSTAVQVAAHSSVPVLVVRGSGAETGLLVLGVDGSTESRAAVAVAFAEADRRRAELVAVRAWTGPGVTVPGGVRPLVYDAELVEGEQRGLLSEALSGYRANHPDVVVTETVLQSRPAAALVEMSRSAQVVVVGSRGRGGFKGLLLGSVSQQLLHHAQCPVMVVPRRMSTVDEAQL
jgi:nucleotide-binding universal stress UspA family protein